MCLFIYTRGCTLRTGDGQRQGDRLPQHPEEGQYRLPPEALVHRLGGHARRRDQGGRPVSHPAQGH